MLKVTLLVGIFLAASLGLVVSPVVAGGGKIAVIPDGDGYINDLGEPQRVVRIYLSPELPCKGTEITFKFVEPKDGDWINVGSPAQPYVMPEDRQTVMLDGNLGTTCTTYAKVGSKSVGNRLFYATVKTRDGQVLDSSQLILHLDNTNYGPSIDPYFFQTLIRPSPIISVTPDRPEMVYPQDGQTIDLEGAYMFKVKPVKGASGYLFGLFQDGVMVYENYRDAKVLSSNGEFALWESNPFHAKFHSGEIKAMVRAQVRGQWTEAREIKVILRPRSMRESSPSGQPSQVVNTPITPNESDQLRKEVNDLQNKLEESWQRQSILERQLNQLVDFIKSIFPFFK